MPYNIVPQNIRAVFNYKFGTTFSGLVEKYKASWETLDVNLSVIYTAIPFSCAIILICLNVAFIDEGLPDTSGESQMKDRLDGFQAKGHGEQLDIWLTCDLGPYVSQNLCVGGLH